MKRYIKVVLCVILITALSIPLFTDFNAETIYTQDGFLYSRSSATTADLQGRESTDGVLTIPKDFSGYYVTNIVDSAFSSDENIVTLDLSKASLLERIGYYAFENCTELSGSIVIAGKINNIGVSAFQGCSSLEEVIMKNARVSVISAQCFYKCSSLNSVILPDDLLKIEKFAFANTAITQITIPSSVTEINYTAFNGCENLVIYCYTDSYAQQFAEDKGIEYVLIDAPLPTEPPTEAPTEAPTTQPTEPVTEEPTQPTSATEAPTEEPTLAPGSYILGDADGSGYVDIVDATFIQRIATNIDVPISREILMHADVDGDDDLTAIDATLIMRHLIRITTPYPIGEQVTT